MSIHTRTAIRRLGTPTTLTRALANGLAESQGVGSVTPEAVLALKNHVRDFLAQKFAIAYLENEGECLDAIQELAQAIGIEVRR